MSHSSEQYEPLKLTVRIISGLGTPAFYNSSVKDDRGRNLLCTKAEICMSMQGRFSCWRCQ